MPPRKKQKPARRADAAPPHAESDASGKSAQQESDSDVENASPGSRGTQVR